MGCRGLEPEAHELKGIDEKISSHAWRRGLEGRLRQSEQSERKDIECPSYIDMAFCCSHQLPDRINSDVKTDATKSRIFSVCAPQNTKTCLTLLRLRLSNVHVKSGIEHNGRSMRG